MKPKNQNHVQIKWITDNTTIRNKENRMPSPTWKAINVINYKLQIHVGYNDRIKE